MEANMAKKQSPVVQLDNLAWQIVELAQAEQSTATNEQYRMQLARLLEAMTIVTDATDQCVVISKE